MPFVLRQFVIRPAFVAAVTALVGCGARTVMLAVPEDEAPVGDTDRHVCAKQVPGA